MFKMMYWIHSIVWFFLVIVFLLKYFINKINVPILLFRLLYMIMVVTGVGMISLINFPLKFVVKGLLAIGLIVMMELLLRNQKKGISDSWILLIFLLLLNAIVMMAYNLI